MQTTINDCLQMLAASQVPVRTRLILESNLIGIKKVLQHDPFTSKKCEFFVKPRFESLREKMRQVADDSGNAEVVPDVIAETCYILIFLSVAET
jgi:hypothetical protein